MNRVKNRLKRLTGQVSALEKLVDQEDCGKTVVQFLAAKSAFDAAFSAFLEKNMEKCLVEKDSEKLSKMIKLIVKK